MTDLRLIGLEGIPNIHPGDDLVQIIGSAIERTGITLELGDILVVTHKIVSKAEGQLVDLTGRSSRRRSRIEWADELRQRCPTGRSRAPRGEPDRADGSRRADRRDATRVHLRQRRRRCIECQPETVCLLPVDPDASAAAIRAGIAAIWFAESTSGVIVSDSFGRPWRNGIVNVAIGVAGLAPLADYRGQPDAAGYELHVSVLAVADELAAAAELVMNKLDARPVVLVRGLQLAAAADAGLAPGRRLFGNRSVRETCSDKGREHLRWASLGTRLASSNSTPPTC